MLTVLLVKITDSYKIYQVRKMRLKLMLLTQRVSRSYNFTNFDRNCLVLKIYTYLPLITPVLFLIKSNIILI